MGLKSFGSSYAWPIRALLALAVVVALAFALVPAWLIRPFDSQSAGALTISYMLKSNAPLVTALALVAGLAAGALIWAASGSLWKAIAALALIPLAAAFWFARQNHFEWMFAPLADVRFAPIREADFIADSDMVLSVTIDGDSAAFPVRQMAYHHIVQAKVGRKNLVATY